MLPSEKKVNEYLNEGLEYCLIGNDPQSDHICASAVDHTDVLGMRGVAGKFHYCHYH